MDSQATFLKELENIEDNADNLRQLFEQLATPIGVIPFVGAGLSIPFGFPGWGTFLTIQGKKAGIDEKIKERLNRGEYEEAAEDLLTARGYRAFHDAISNTFGSHRIKGKELRGAISYVPRLASGPVITTNFDHVLEEVFKQSGAQFEREVLGANIEMAIKALIQHRKILLKIHGDAEVSTSRILTKRDYSTHYGSSDGSIINFSLALPRLLKKMLEDRPLLFLGCSLNQDRTIAVLKEVSTDSLFIAHYAIVEQTSSMDLFYERSRFLSDHNIRPIWYPSGQHELIEPLLAHIVEKNSSEHLHIESLDDVAKKAQIINISFVEQSDIKDDLREQLKKLTYAVDAMVKELPKEEAEEAVFDMVQLVEQAAKENPNPKWVKVSIDGLIKAAANLGQVGEPVINLAGKVRNMLIDNLEASLEEQLRLLRKTVDAMAKDLPKEKAEEVVYGVNLLAEEAAKENPNPKWVKVSIDGLIKAASNLDSVGEPVIKLAGKVLALLMAR